MSNLGIYITSANRANKLITLQSLPARWRTNTFIVVKGEERDNYITALKGTGVRLLTAPHDIKLMSPKRQWAIEQSPQPYFMMLDDDLTFYKRVDGKITQLTPDEVGVMLDMLLADLESGIPFVGISSRAGNNHVLEDYTECTRVSRCWAFKKSTYMDLGINIAPFPDYVIDDFHTILSFLEAGYKNRVYFNYTQADKGSNTEGGCSTYRNNDVQTRSAQWLFQQHPRFVKVVRKETKQSWQGMDKRGGMMSRTDIIIKWKEAYESSQKKQVTRAKSGITDFL